MLVQLLRPGYVETCMLCGNGECENSARLGSILHLDETKMGLAR